MPNIRSIILYGLVVSTSFSLTLGATIPSPLQNRGLVDDEKIMLNDLIPFVLTPNQGVNWITDKTNEAPLGAKWSRRLFRTKSLPIEPNGPGTYILLWNVSLDVYTMDPRTRFSGDATHGFWFYKSKVRTTPLKEEWMFSLCNHYTAQFLEAKQAKAQEKAGAVSSSSPSLL